MRGYADTPSWPPTPASEGGAALSYAPSPPAAAQQPSTPAVSSSAAPIAAPSATAPSSGSPTPAAGPALAAAAAAAATVAHARQAGVLPVIGRSQSSAASSHRPVPVIGRSPTHDPASPAAFQFRGMPIAGRRPSVARSNGNAAVRALPLHASQDQPDGPTGAPDAVKSAAPDRLQPAAARQHPGQTAQAAVRGRTAAAMEGPAGGHPAAFGAQGGTRERAYDSASSVDALDGLLLPHGRGQRCGTPPKPQPPPPEAAPGGTPSRPSPPHVDAATAEISIASQDGAEASAAEAGASPWCPHADRSRSAPAESVACPGVPADVPSPGPTSAAARSPAGLVAAAGWTPPSPAATSASSPAAGPVFKPPTASPTLSLSSGPAGRLPSSCPGVPLPASPVCPDSGNGGSGSSSSSSSGLHYAAVFLTAAAQRKLLEYAPPQHAKVFADHVTLLYRPSMEQVKNPPPLPYPPRQRARAGGIFRDALRKVCHPAAAGLQYIPATRARAAVSAASRCFPDAHGNAAPCTPIAPPWTVCPTLNLPRTLACLVAVAQWAVLVDEALVWQHNVLNSEMKDMRGTARQVMGLALREKVVLPVCDMAVSDRTQVLRPQVRCLQSAWHDVSLQCFKRGPEHVQDSRCCGRKV